VRPKAETLPENCWKSELGKIAPVKTTGGWNLRRLFNYALCPHNAMIIFKQSKRKGAQIHGKFARL